MLVGGLALLPGLLTVPAALVIAVSMAYAVLFLNGHGAPFIPPEPYELPKGGDSMGFRGLGRTGQLGEGSDVCCHSAPC